MDHIKKAIEKATQAKPIASGSFRSIKPQLNSSQASTAAAQTTFLELHSDLRSLEQNRILAGPGTNPFRFDQLRTRVQREMRERDWKTLMVTSPTIGCGKSVTAINLAMSLARQPESFTALVDLDLRKPQMLQYLGVRAKYDIYDVLGGSASLNEVLFSLTLSGPNLVYLPTKTPAPRPAEILSSTPMHQLVSSLKAMRQRSMIIFDMPPVLVVDDVLAFMPQVDGVLLVVAAGQSTAQQVEECRRSLPQEKLLGLVLTKSEERLEEYQY